MAGKGSAPKLKVGWHGGLMALRENSGGEGIWRGLGCRLPKCHLPVTARYSFQRPLQSVLVISFLATIFASCIVLWWINSQLNSQLGISLGTSCEGLIYKSGGSAGNASANAVAPPIRAGQDSEAVLDRETAGSGAPGYGQLPEWTPAVPNAVLRKAVAYRGDMLRMDAFLHKVVVAREPVTVVAIGTSIAADFGGYKGPRSTGLVANYRFWPKHGWLSTPLDYLVAQYPPRTLLRWPNASEASEAATEASEAATEASEAASEASEAEYWLRNEALPGIGPIFWLSCVGKMRLEELPAKVDLVVVDYAILGPVEVLDAVMQHLLSKWWPPPAFLFVNFFYWCRGYKFCRISKPGSPAVNMSDPEIALDWSTLGTFTFSQLDVDGQPAGTVQEDDIMKLARHYGFPVLSMRDAFFHLAGHKVPNYTLHDFINQFDVGMHPSFLQSRTRFADVIISFFRSAIKGMEYRQAGLAMPGGAASVAPLLEAPPPCFGNNTFLREESRFRVKYCYSVDRGLAIPIPVHSSVGFELTADWDTKKDKPGIIAWTAGSRLTLAVNTLATGHHLNFSSPAAAQAAQAIVQLSYLQSYERMGDASVACGGACSCSPVVLNGTITQHWSVPTSTDIVVSQAASCHIVLTVLQGTRGGQKFKILGLTVMFRFLPSA